MGDVSYAPLIDEMIWSYSRLRSFRECRYQWYLKYIWDPDIETAPLYFSQFGKLAHDILARRSSGIITPDEAESEFYLRYFSEVTAKPMSQKIETGYFKTGASGVRAEILPHEKTLAIEEKFLFRYAGVPFVAYPDYVSENDDSDIAITDHKSRLMKPRSARKKPTRSDEELTEYLKQLYVYSAAIKTEFDRLPSELRFHCFRSGTLIREPYDPDAAAETEKWARGVIDEARETVHFYPDLDWFRCNYICDVHDHCEYYDSVFRKR